MSILVLKDNSPEIRDKIKTSGIEVCHCAEFKNSVWLDYSGVNGVHGVGYYNEEVGTKSVQEELNRFVTENKDIIFCQDVNEFIDKIKHKDGYIKRIDFKNRDYTEEEFELRYGKQRLEFI